MLFDQKDTFSEKPDDDSSALSNWMRINGKDTLEKWKEFEKSGFNKCLTFSGDFLKFELFFYFNKFDFLINKKKPIITNLTHLLIQIISLASKTNFLKWEKLFIFFF